MLVDIVGFKMGLKRLVVELIEGIGSQRSLQELLFCGKGARPSLLKENGLGRRCIDTLTVVKSQQKTVVAIETVRHGYIDESRGFLKKIVKMHNLPLIFPRK